MATDTVPDNYYMGVPDDGWKWITCPHTTEKPTRDSQFYNLIDEPGNVVTLVLCGRCKAVVLDGNLRGFVQGVLKAAERDETKRLQRSLMNEAKR